MPERGSDAAIVRLLEGGELWGLELDTAYRVFAATIEPPSGSHPDGEPEDRRLQLLLFPTSELRVVLERRLEEGLRIETFEVDQLAAVGAALGGAVVGEVTLDGATPDLARLSLHARSDAPDGRAHTLGFRAVATSGEALTLLAWFDDLQLRRPDGSDIDPGTLTLD